MLLVVERTVTADLVPDTSRSLQGVLQIRMAGNALMANAKWAGSQREEKSPIVFLIAISRSFITLISARRPKPGSEVKNQ